MNFVEDNVTEDDKKTKKIMITLGVVLVILLIVSIVLIILIGNLQSQQFKFKVDTKATELSTADLFVFEEDKVYVSIKDLASIVGYKYYNGGYKQYSEDNNSCYIESSEEICTFESGSNKIYKTPVDELDYSFFTIEQPVKVINDKLYVIASGMEIASNIQLYYDKELNEIDIYTLPYLTDFYINNYEYSAIKENFNNQKAILYNLLVVQNTKNTDSSYNERDLRYGIITLDGAEVVGTKYTNIEFIESTKEFLVTTDENKVGIVTASGETKVKPQYDALKQIDKDLNLYLATSNDKKGVIEKNGKILIYLEYDSIGINSKEFESSNIKNPYVLYSKVIPVEQNGRYGLYDVKGNVVIPLEYDGLGCISNTRNLNSCVTVPDVEGIVFARNYEIEKYKKITLYGVLSPEGKTLVPAGLESIYYVVNNGREEYTMISYPDQKSYDVIKYIEENR